MAEGMILGLDRPFVEEEEDNIKLIVEFAQKVTKEKLRTDVDLAARKIENMGVIVSDVRTDEGVTPFAIFDLATTNINFSKLVEINDVLLDMEGYKGLTISTVDLPRIERLARKR